MSETNNLSRCLDMISSAVTDPGVWSSDLYFFFKMAYKAQDQERDVEDSQSKRFDSLKSQCLFGGVRLDDLSARGAFVEMMDSIFEAEADSSLLSDNLMKQMKNLKALARSFSQMQTRLEVANGEALDLLESVVSCE